MIVVIILLSLIVFIIGMTAFGVFFSRGGGQNSTFLEWDPVDRTNWRREVDEGDVHHMLEQLNQRRIARGEEPQTMAEYIEQVRRD